jgi:hypothetical protein
MVEHDSLPVRMMNAISGALKPVLGEGGFDAGIDGRARAMEVSTDDWTVYIEWERGVAWLAIDDEPDDPGKYEQARRAVMSEAEEEAWRRINDEIDGFLIDALTRTGDPFSIAFAAAISDRDDGAAGSATA